MNISSLNRCADPTLGFLAGAGEMRSLIRDYDWNSTALGPIEQWPITLKAVLAVMLGNAEPAYIAWGPDHLQLYNDAYIPMLGNRKHPKALGLTTRETWDEIWEFVGPLFDGVTASGRAVTRQNLLFPMVRTAGLGEYYFSFSYSPIPDVTGKIQGVLAIARETTYEVISQRRTDCIRTLVHELADADRRSCLPSVFEKICRASQEDIPFALWYECDDSLGTIRLVKAVGIPVGTSVSPETINRQSDPFYAGLMDFQRLHTTSRSIQEERIREAGTWRLNAPPTHVLIKPLRYSDGTRADGYLVFATNPLSSDCEAQQEFFQTFRFHVENAIWRISRQALEWRELEHRFEFVMSVLPCMVWTSDTKNQIVFFNRAWLDFTGRALHQELKGGWMAGIHPADRELVEQCLADCDQSSGSKFEARLLSADGSYRCIYCETTPRFDVSHEYCGQIGTCFDITERKANEVEITSSRNELRTLYGTLQATREEERRSLAREVHDQLGQILSAAKIDIALLESDFALADRTLSACEVRQELRSARRSIEKSIEVVRHLATELRPPELQIQGLGTAIRWHANDFQRRTGIACNVQIAVERSDWTDEIRTTLFRIFQEAMTNVLRHAKATRTNISVEEIGERVRLRVVDNGVGIKLPRRRSDSNGLKGMQERANLFGGRCLIGRAPGSGTFVSVSIPFNYRPGSPRQKTE